MGNTVYKRFIYKDSDFIPAVGDYMNIFQIVGVGIIGAILSLTVKKYNPDLSILISIASGLIIIFGILESISQILDVLKLISEKSGIN